MVPPWPVLWALPLLSASVDVEATAPSPALALCISRETTSYRVSMGILGQVARLRMEVSPGHSQQTEPLPPTIRAIAQGSGSVLGFGKGDQEIEGELDVRQMHSQRWRNVRSRGSSITTDTGEQLQPGTVTLLRKRSNEADRADSFTRAAPILDPVSFLLYLRMALPTKPAMFEVLDGRALWLASTSAARADAHAQNTWRIDGKLEPIFWNGTPDRERKSYTFSMFLTRDRFRTLTKLVAPFGFGDIEAELIHAERKATDRRDVVRALYCASPTRRGAWQTIAASAKAMQAPTMR